MTHVLLGDRDDYAHVVEAAAHRSTVRWFVPKSARPGEGVFLVFPAIGFGAIGEIIGNPVKVVAGFGNRRYKSGVGRLRLIDNPTPLDVVRARVPNWAWLTYPRGYTSVADSLAARLRQLISGYREEAMALEGIRRETSRLARSRNRALRNRVLERAHGVCEACRRDFLKVLGGAGARVLQVHHRRQLAVSDFPRLTRQSDLSVLCANCHALVHLDPTRALRVHDLRRRLARDWR